MQTSFQQYHVRCRRYKSRLRCLFQKDSSSRLEIPGTDAVVRGIRYHKRLSKKTTFPTETSKHIEVQHKSFLAVLRGQYSFRTVDGMIELTLHFDYNS